MESTNYRPLVPFWERLNTGQMEVVGCETQNGAALLQYSHPL